MPQHTGGTCVCASSGPQQQLLQECACEVSAACDATCAQAGTIWRIGGAFNDVTSADGPTWAPSTIVYMTSKVCRLAHACVWTQSRWGDVRGWAHTLLSHHCQHTALITHVDCQWWHLNYTADAYIKQFAYGAVSGSRPNACHITSQLQCRQYSER